MMSQALWKRCYLFMLSSFLIFITPLKAVVTAKEMVGHLVHNTMTSQVMEAYIGERLKFRTAYWNEQFKQWQQRWGVTVDKDFHKTFKVSSLSPEALYELSKIPFYSFAAGNNEELSAKIQKKYQAYVYSDTSNLARWRYVSKVPDDALGNTCVAYGRIVVFINDSWYVHDLKKNSDYVNMVVHRFFSTIEHEITHVVQFFGAMMLYKLLKAHYGDSLIMNHAFARSSFRCFSQRLMYDMLADAERCAHDHSRGISENILNALKTVRVAVEREADKHAIAFVEGSMLGYVYYTEKLGIDRLTQEQYENMQRNFAVKKYDTYSKRGYCTYENRFRLLVKRLMAEGRLRYEASSREKDVVSFDMSHLDEHGQFIVRSRL